MNVEGNLRLIVILSQLINVSRVKVMCKKIMHNYL